MAELNEQQLVLLNSLVYLNESCAKDVSVGSIVNDMLESGSLEGKKYGGGMSPEDVEDLLKNIAADPDLCSLTVVDYVDTAIRGVCFEDPNGEALIAYRGTGPYYAAWDDNCQGGYLTDTDMQKEALEFAQEQAMNYDNITVTGHSKGGNLAQYVTVLMGDEIDRCVSFDGQGFGDEFLEKYADEIKANKDKIRSVCAYNDYVNILLTPIAGEIVYLDNEKSAFPGGHFVYELYKADKNKLNDKGEYVNVKKQDPLIWSLKNLLNAVTTLIDWNGKSNHFQEFLQYSLVGMLMGVLVGSKGKSFTEILAEVKANLEDFLESSTQMWNRYVSHSFAVSTAALYEYSQTLAGAASDLDYLRSRIKRLQRAMATNVVNGVAIGVPLQLILSQLDSETEKLGKLSAVLQRSAEAYDAAEKAAKACAGQ